MSIKPVATIEEDNEKYATSGFFNVSSIAKRKVDEKRKRKGIEPFIDRRKSLTAQLFCYGGSLAVTKTMLAPLERMKNILQVQHIANVPAKERIYSSTGLFGNITSQQGFNALFRGNMANVYKGFLQTFVKLTLYDRIKYRIMPSNTQDVSNSSLQARRVLAAFLCTILSFGFTYPMDLIHTRLTVDLSKKVQPRLYKTSFECFNRTHIDEGYRAFYKGALFSLIASIPYTLILLPTYDYLKERFNQSRLEKDDPFIQKLYHRFGASSIAVLIAQSICYPADTVRRCLQMNGGHGQLKLYNGAFDCIKKLYQAYGIQGFYRGFHLNIMRSIPAVFIQFSIYEKLKGYTDLE